MNKIVRASTKKEFLKKMVKGQGKRIGKSPTGASPFKMGNGLGKNSLGSQSGDAITGGGGSNLGKNGVF